MKPENITYTGFLKFRGIDFSFVFSDDELRMIPPADKSNEIRYKWLMKEIKDGVYTEGDPLIVEEESIIASCNENGGQIIFLPIVGSIISSGSIIAIGSQPPILRMRLSAYILCRYQRDSISRISFSGPEINYIHPVNQCISWQYNPEETARGVFRIETNDFTSTTTKEQLFSVDENAVTSKFSITRGVSLKIDEAPLTLKSSLMFELEPTSDYGLVLRLCRIAKEYISFLCYRKNVVFDEIELSAPHEEGKHEKFASLFIIEKRNEPEEKPLKDKRCIKQLYVDDGEGRLLQDIADNRLFIRHLPVSYESGRHIDASRFVMITAAFEWEFKRMKPDGLPKSDSRKQAEEKADSTIDELIASRTGKEKEIYKFLKKLIGAASLQNEIVSACEEFDPIIGVFGKRLYSMNEEELVYSDMGKRLSDQRNHFAHGDIDKDFIGTALLDLIFLEYVVYAMQLKFYGISDDYIRKAINDLFHLNFAV